MPYGPAGSPYRRLRAVPKPRPRRTPGDPGRGRVTPKGQAPAAIDPALLARLMAMGFRYEEIAPLARKAEAAGVLDVERYIIKELIG